MTNRILYNGIAVPQIVGSKGGGKGGNGSVSPNSLFSTDVLLLTIALGEGPLYRINPNGPQDIEIQDSAIDDLIDRQRFTDKGSANSNYGRVDSSKFTYSAAYGTVNQAPLKYFGSETVSPQSFASPIVLKRGGDVTGVYQTIAEGLTSTDAWDSINFNFVVAQLATADTKGNVTPNTVNISIKLYSSITRTLILTDNFNITGKTDQGYRYQRVVLIPSSAKSTDGYYFSITKTSKDSDNQYNIEDIRVTGWDEIKNDQMSYPRTALIGYAIKATAEHSGGVPNITSLLKGLIVKVPSNYNQPILSDGSIDWRELEVGDVGASYPYTTGYRLQKTGSTVLTGANPNIYIGTWDGSFVYSWTQNPVWILYDLLTNTVYGMGISEEFIDKYKFYQIAQYCDAVDPFNGNFVGVKGLADGTFRHRPYNYLSTDPTKELKTQLGIPSGTPIIERRFILDVSLTEQEKGMDVVNSLAATFRSVLVYAGGKITLATDMPDELPSLIFNESNIKEGTFQISGVKESDLITGVDVSYTDPTNHFKKETVRVDLNDIDAPIATPTENILSLDLNGVTRRSQAMRLAQYHVASSRYVRRSVTFTSGTEALSLSPGDIISVSGQTSGINYGYGGIITAPTVINEANVYLEHYTIPALTSTVFTANTKPLALRIIRKNTDKLSLYLLSNTDFTLTATGNAAVGADYARVKVISEYNPITKSLMAFTGFTSANALAVEDYWSIGEWVNPSNFYTTKSGRLFKVTSVNRESLNEVTISGNEYIPNVYFDSDSFINYEPIPYTDITSPLSLPPSPDFTFTAVPVQNYSNTVTIQGVVQATSTKDGYNQSYATEFYIANPSDSTIVTTNFNTANNQFAVLNNANLAVGTLAYITGKNGFITNIGDLKLLCTKYTVDSFNQEIALTIPGLSQISDDNSNSHIFDAARVLGVIGSVNISLPINDKKATASSRNFVGYVSNESYISVPILRYSGDIVYVKDIISSGAKLSAMLTSSEFYVRAYQPLVLNKIYQKAFYISGTAISYNYTPNLVQTYDVATYYDLPIKPFSVNDVSLYVDGTIRNLVGGTAQGLNLNKNLSIPANIWYTTASGETDMRIEIERYTVPAIERYDMIEAGVNNTFTVIGTTYDPSDSYYNPYLTANNVFKIYTDTEPQIPVQGRTFKNVTQNPQGYINNVSGNTFTFDYSTASYPGLLNLSNTNVYSLELDGIFTKYFLAENGIIPNLPIGTTTLKARNRNITGRTSPYIERSVRVENLPIKKVDNLLITEEIYLEQLGGASVRVTISFDPIQNQQVTDYEISYRLIEGRDTGTNPSLADYNTVKVSAQGTDDNGRIRFSINNISRGDSPNVNSIEVKVTALSNSLRGLERVVSQEIQGKTAKPQNILNLIVGQQDNSIFFGWRFARDASGSLIDLDLKEVVIRRIAGIAGATIDNFLIASDFYTASYPATAINVPIDFYDTYTYLIRTRDTSGNWSETVVSYTITLIKSYRDTTIAGYSEDQPTVPVSGLANANNTEAAFGSFYVLNGGFRKPTSNKYANANGTSSGWSVSPTNATDLLATSNAYYITQVRDLGAVYTGVLRADISGYQALETTYNSYKSTIKESVSQYPLNSYAANQLKALYTNTHDFTFSPDGTNLYAVVSSGTTNVSQYTLSTPWNITTATLVGNFAFATEPTPTGIAFHPSGNYYFVTGTTNAKVTRYNVSSSWNVATSIMGSNVSVITDTPNPRCLRFSPDGMNLYVATTTRTSISQYSLSNAWDISTTTYLQNVAIIYETGLSGFTFLEDGSKMYATGTTMDNIYAYTVTESWNVASIVYQSNLYINTLSANPRALYAHNYGRTIFLKGNEINIRRLDASTNSSNTLSDNTGVGIGTLIRSYPNGRYDSNNRTWMTSGQDGEVWALWNPGQFNNDLANANSYALIAGVIDGNTLAIGGTFSANGASSTQNNFSNITFGGSRYFLVNLRQYNDLGDATYGGTEGAVSTKTYVKYAVNNVYYAANGNVNPAAFTSDYSDYVASKNTFRYFQIKHVIQNNIPNEVDYVLDRVKYTVNKEKITYSNTIPYTSTSMNVTFEGTDFVFTPAVSFTIANSAAPISNTITTVIQALTNSYVVYRVVYANGSGDYAANGSALVSITATGV